MKVSKNEVYFAFFIGFILIAMSMYNIVLGLNRNSKAKKIYTSEIKKLKEKYNLVIDKDKYAVKYKGQSCGGYIAKGYDYYIMEKKEKEKYKSKYFSKEKEEKSNAYMIAPSNDYVLVHSWSEVNSVFENKEHLLEEPGSGFLFEMIETFGFKPYIFNEFLYDKTKGNDFREIEKIFDKYKGGKIRYYSQYPVWDCGTIESNVRQGSMLFVDDEKCGISDEKDKKGRYSLRKLKEYGNRFSQYFSEKRDFETIDWYEFKKFNNLHPIIIFEVYNAEKKELEKMRDEIKKYYNDKELTIVLVGYPEKNFRSGKDKEKELVAVW